MEEFWDAVERYNSLLKRDSDQALRPMLAPTLGGQSYPLDR